MIAIAHRRNGTAMQELRHTGGDDLHQLGNGRAKGCRVGQPAEPPAGHHPGFREAVNDEKPVIMRGDLQEGRGHIPVKNELMVNLVSDDPDTPLPREIEKLLLLFPLDHPARRIARRVDENRLGLFADRREQRLKVKMPVIAAQTERDMRADAAIDLHRGIDIRPDRADHQHLVARLQNHLHGKGKRRHAAGRQADPVRIERDVEGPVHIGGDFFTKIKNAALVGIEGLAPAHGIGGCLGDESRGRQVPLAEP